MDTAPGKLPQLAAESKHIVERVLTIGGNRVGLLMVELQEQAARERLLLAILLALDVAVFGLLAGIALDREVAVIFCEAHPIITLVVWTAIYTVIASLLIVI